jgi:hypothetical protein
MPLTTGRPNVGLFFELRNRPTCSTPVDEATASTTIAAENP